MRVCRLAAGQCRETDGEGARVYGGRWNSPGIPVVHAATRVSLALLEQLVHVDRATTKQSRSSVGDDDRDCFAAPLLAMTG